MSLLVYSKMCDLLYVINLHNYIVKTVRLKQCIINVCDKIQIYKFALKLQWRRFGLYWSNDRFLGLAVYDIQLQLMRAGFIFLKLNLADHDQIRYHMRNFRRRYIIKRTHYDKFSVILLYTVS